MVYNFGVKTNPVLPATFDDSLSYYECILKLKDMFDSFVKEINAIVDGFDNSYKEYTDEKFAEVLALVDSKISDFSTDYTNFKIAINNAISSFQFDIDSFKEETNQSVKGAFAYTDSKIAANNDYIFERIGNEIIDIKVRNYFTGELVSIQDMLDYLADFHAENAILYNVLAEKNIDYTAFAALDITYTQLAVNGNNLIN